MRLRLISITLPHEAMHMYYRKTLGIKRSNMFKEVESNFMEFISKHYLIEHNIYKKEVSLPEINIIPLLLNSMLITKNLSTYIINISLTIKDKPNIKEYVNEKNIKYKINFF